MSRWRRRIVTVMLAMSLSSSLLIPHQGWAAAPHAPVSAGKLLYSWKLPVSGHSGPWRIVGHLLSYGGDGNGAVFAPYTLHTANFAVEALMKSGGVGGLQANMPGYGLVARTKVSDPHTSVAAGSYFSTNGSDNNPEIYWDGQTVGGATFDPKTSWHRYRFEVRGDQYSLSIDGTPMAAYTISGYTGSRRVGVFSAYYKVKVREFKVYALSPPVSHIVTAPETKRFNLTLSDLPTDGFYAPYSQHWITNRENADIRQVPQATLDALGRIVSHSEGFAVSSPVTLDVYSSVAVYTTTTGAQTDMTQRYNEIKATDAAVPSFHNQREIKGISIGDMSAALSFEFSVEGFGVRELLLFATRGRYFFYLRFSFDAKTSFDQDLAYATNLAKVVDQRIQHG